MRLPLIPPADLTPEQRPLYDDMREGIAKSFKGFVAMRDDGTLLGPWNPWLHEPSFGKASWDLVRALADKPSLPKPVREVAILVTGCPRLRLGFLGHEHGFVGIEREFGGCFLA
jgi:hypothetical protein